MYYIYNVEKKDNICSYSFIDEIKLFGSVNGIIVKILQKIRIFKDICQSHRIAGNPLFLNIGLTQFLVIKSYSDTTY